MHQSGAAATGDHLAPLIGRGMLEFDDSGVWHFRVDLPG